MLIKSVITAAIVGLTMMTAFAQTTKVTDLPDVSVIGVFQGEAVDGQTKEFGVEEIEFAFQHFLYPGVKAEVFTTFAKEDDGTHAAEFEEGYVTFADVFNTLLPSQEWLPGVSVVVGKRLLSIGRLNVLHTESLPFVGHSLANKQFFGESHGLSGEGAAASYLLPLPFFSQVELGFWTPTAEEEEEEEDHSEIEYENRIINGRVWNAFKLQEATDLEVGLSYVFGNPTADESYEEQHVVGVDVVLNHELDKTRTLKVHTEYYSASYAEDDETSRESQDGGFVSTELSLDDKHDVGLRYGVLGKHGDEGSTMSQLALSLTRQLTDTTKFRVQYNTGENVEDAIYAQFIFGMGPHSHILQ